MQRRNYVYVHATAGGETVFPKKMHKVLRANLCLSWSNTRELIIVAAIYLCLKIRENKVGIYGNLIITSRLAKYCRFLETNQSHGLFLFFVLTSFKRD